MFSQDISKFSLQLILINLEAALLNSLSCKYCVSFTWDNHNIGSMQCTCTVMHQPKGFAGFLEKTWFSLPHQLLPCNSITGQIL